MTILITDTITRYVGSLIGDIGDDSTKITVSPVPKKQVDSGTGTFTETFVDEIGFIIDGNVRLKIEQIVCNNGVDNGDGTATYDIQYRGLKNVETAFPTESYPANYIDHQETALVQVDWTWLIQKMAQDFNTNVSNRGMQQRIYPDGVSLQAGKGRGGWEVFAKYDSDVIDKVYASVSFPGDTGSTTIDIVKQINDFLGDSTTQFDITDEGSDTFRYTYDGTGTDPVIEDSVTSIQVGDIMTIYGANFNSANNGYFEVTAVGDNYFEITNASGVAESNKTLGIGFIDNFRSMLTTPITIASGAKRGVGVVNPTYQYVAAYDVHRIDILSVSTTAPKGDCKVSMELLN